MLMQNLCTFPAYWGKEMQISSAGPAQPFGPQQKNGKLGLFKKKKAFWRKTPSSAQKGGSKEWVEVAVVLFSISWLCKLLLQQ